MTATLTRARCLGQVLDSRYVFENEASNEWSLFLNLKWCFGALDPPLSDHLSPLLKLESGEGQTGVIHEVFARTQAFG